MIIGRDNKKFRKVFIAFLLFALSLGVFGVFSPVQAAGASLYLSPGAGTYVIGGTFSVAVKVNSDGQEINSAEGLISYDTNLLTALSVSKGGSIFMFWPVEPNISGGTISFGGGRPSSYNGTAGHIITITFKAKKSGGAQVRFSSGAVLAHDGKGTNVLASMGSGSYTISPKVITPPASKTNQNKKPAPPKEEIYNKPIIKSESHPNENTWYNKKDVKFNWEPEKSVKGISILFDQEEFSNPGPKSDGLFNEKEYPETKDGIWYLHLKYKDAKKWGTIANYKVMIDTVPPEPFELEYIPGGLEDWPKINFKTEDKLSGLDRYEVYIKELNKPDYKLSAEENSLKLENLKAGVHPIMIKAIDKAGNERVINKEFEIEPIPTPIIVNYPSEIRESDNFYMNGTALSSAQINIYIEKDGKLIKEEKTWADANGNWFYISKQKLDNNRYISWVDAIDDKGIISKPSAKISFIVSPPIFAIVGNYIINYFTILVSLLFLIVLIVLLIFLIFWLSKKKLKKETIEIEEVLHSNIGNYKKTIDIELDKLKGGVKLNAEKEKTKMRLKKKVDEAEKSILKEVKDVEKLLK